MESVSLKFTAVVEEMETGDDRWYKWEDITVNLYLNQILEYIWVRDHLRVKADV